MELIQHTSRLLPLEPRKGGKGKSGGGSTTVICLGSGCPHLKPWVIAVIVAAILWGIIFLAGLYAYYLKERDRKRAGKSFRPTMILWGAVKITCFLWVGYVAVEEWRAWRDRRRERKTEYGKIEEGSGVPVVAPVGGGYGGGCDGDGETAAGGSSRYERIGYTGAGAGVVEKETESGPSMYSAGLPVRDGAVSPLTESERLGRTGQNVSTKSTYAPDALSILAAALEKTRSARFPPMQVTYAPVRPGNGRQ